MITEDFVSKEIAELLKEKGFDEETRSCYYLNDTSKVYLNGSVSCNYNGYGFQNICVSAPTLQMAIKWLREVCGLIISIEFQAICSTWKWRIYIKSSNKKHTDFQHYNKYEEAVETAIKYCLEHLI